MDVQLELGNVASQVEVPSQAPLLDVNSATVATVVNAQLIPELTLNGRNKLSLARIPPFRRGLQGIGVYQSAEARGHKFRSADATGAANFRMPRSSGLIRRSKRQSALAGRATRGFLAHVEPAADGYSASFLLRSRQTRVPEQQTGRGEQRHIDTMPDGHSPRHAGRRARRQQHGNQRKRSSHHE